MPLCVAGMHRSGTSLVARLLAASGVYCGPATELVVPAPDNADGLGENVRFLRLNDDILGRLGGFWDRPPVLPPGWASSPRLSRLRQRAERLLGGYRGREPWFWKDPRNSLTLPFWRAVIPDLRVVVCVRDPSEVVASLDRRERRPSADGWALWLAYNRQALAAPPVERRVVTHYAAYLHDAPAELERVAGALGLSLSPETIARACTIVAPRDGRHAGSGAGVWPAEVAQVYDALCEEAGPVFRRALTAPGPRRPPGRPPAEGQGNRGAGRGAGLRRAIGSARRVWRQEGVGMLARVVGLRLRRETVRARDALGGARARPHRRSGIEGASRSDRAGDAE